MNKCTTCIFYNIQSSITSFSLIPITLSSLTKKVNLNFCVKHKTYTDISRSDKLKCGPSARHYTPFPSKTKNKVPFYI